MYLKKISIVGFKSFAEKVELDLKKGVTGIVGPNGSGKSNITEAIRWVLGETSAKSLRGSKMPDIIFAGSQTKRAMQTAHVTVVLDNTDHYLPLEYSEIAITRKITRQGDSDYFINKKRVRLKDIQELFMDSGLGKESFSIISQGKVESIFNSKPEERRGIFEEAAGVFKYKQKKKEAEHKLFETEDNLNRINDIVFELNEQLEPLRKESQKAKQYVQFKKELKQIEVAITAKKIQQEKQQWLTFHQQTTDLTKKLNHCQVQLHRVEDELQQKKEQHEQLDEQLTKAQIELLEQTKKFEKVQSHVALLQQEEQSNHLKKEQLEQHHLHLQQEEQNLLIQKEQYEKEKETLTRALTKILNTIDEQKNNVLQFSRSIKEQIEDVRAELIERMQEEVKIKNEQKHLEVENNRFVAQLTKIKQKVEELKVKQQHIEKEYDQFQKRQTNATEKLTQLMALLTKKQEKLDQLQRQFDPLQQHHFSCLSQFQQKQARLKSLKDISEKHAGYYQGVRAILRQKQLHGIKGAVAENISVLPHLTLAIETALGASMQHIIVKNEQAAKQAIQFLKENRLGRATFLPLTTVKRKHIPEEYVDILKKEDDFIGLADQLITYDPVFQPIFSYLLGTTCIVKHLNSAIRLSKYVQHRYKFVTLTGDVMHAGGVMSGGAVQKQKGGLLSQQEEKRKLEKEVFLLEEEVKVAKDTLTSSQQTQETLQKEIRILQQNETAGKLLVQELEQSEALKQQEIAQLKQQETLLHLDYKHLIEEQKHALNEQTTLTLVLTEIKQEQQQLQDQMRQLEQTGSNNEQAKQQAQQKLQEAEKQEVALRKELDHIQERLTVLLTTKEKNNHSQQEVTAQLYEQNKQEKEKIKKELNEQQQQTKKKMSALEQKIQLNTKEKKEVYQTIKQLELHFKQYKENENQTHVQQIKQQNQQDHHHHQLKQALEFLKEEYQLTYEQAKEEFPLHVSFESGLQTIQQLKQKIEQLGTVNLYTIEQFQTVNERYDFLTKQRDDLIQAKAHLFVTMQEMDEKVKQQFLETFEAIQAQFQLVFPKMFGGGMASLSFTDPKELLTTGIEIKAQPPGKKRQRLSLLSGGERALTAIALLFSILQVRPVPFTILDEVEAALDEANVTRFGHYLQSFEKTRQFIVVTHRKGTMMFCDVLFGVTMERSGVSKLLSVSLKDKEKWIENEKTKE